MHIPSSYISERLKCSKMSRGLAKTKSLIPRGRECFINKYSGMSQEDCQERNLTRHSVFLKQHSLATLLEYTKNRAMLLFVTRNDVITSVHIML